MRNLNRYFLSIMLLGMGTFLSANNNIYEYEIRFKIKNVISEGFKAKPVLQNESNIFWGALIICPILWIFFAFMSLLSVCPMSLKVSNINVFSQPSWFIVCITAAAFNGANLYGYVRCKFGAMDNIKGKGCIYFIIANFKFMNEVIHSQ